MFVGAELRYLRSYSGLGLDRFEGQALFLEQTFHAKLQRQPVDFGCVLDQIAGRSDEASGRQLDLDNFSATKPS